MLVRLALLHLLAGAALGVAILAERTGLGPALAGGAVAAHVELLLVGWLVQLAMGVASWILPRGLSGRRTGRAEGRGLLLAVLLNLGVLGSAAAWLGALGPTWLAAGHGASLAAVLLFVHHGLGRLRVAAAVRRRRDRASSSKRAT